MSTSIRFENKLPHNRKKKELIVFLFSAFLVLSMLFYFSFKENAPQIPSDFPAIYIYCSNNVDDEDYIDWRERNIKYYM